MFYRLKVSFYFLKFTRLCIIFVLFILYKIIEFESDHTGVVTEPNMTLGIRLVSRIKTSPLTLKDSKIEACLTLILF